MIEIKQYTNEIKGVINIFKKNDIKIIADYGTLLGCVRHNGFIPWDKDLDFSILCDENIEKKLKKAFIELTENNYFIYNIQNKKNRIKIDYKGALNKRAVVCKNVYVDLFFWWLESDNIWRRKHYLGTDIEKNKGKLIHNDWVDEIIEMTYEDITLPCPSNYDELLTHRYGDWKINVKY